MIQHCVQILFPYWKSALAVSSGSNTMFVD